MSFWCWHKWTKWATDATGITYMQYDALTGRKLEDHEKYSVGTFERQRRHCEKCGKVQLRRVKDK